MIFAFLSSRTTKAVIRVNKKRQSINQKDPISSITPNNETLSEEEKREEIKDIITTPKRESIKIDLGITIFPSLKRAAAQDMIATTKPKTKSKVFAVSIGILVNGKKKIGNNTITEKIDQNEILSKIFDNICFLIKSNLILIILYIILQKYPLVQLNHYVNKSIFNIDYPLYDLPF